MKKRYGEFPTTMKEDVIQTLFSVTATIEASAERAANYGLPALEAHLADLTRCYLAAIRELQAISALELKRPLDPCGTCDGLGAFSNGITKDGPCPDCGGTGSRSSDAAMRIRVGRAKARVPEVPEDYHPHGDVVRDGGIGDTNDR